MSILDWFNPTRWLILLGLCGALTLGYFAWQTHQRGIGEDRATVKFTAQIATIKLEAEQAKSKAVQSALAETVRLQGVKDAALKQAETRARSNAVALANARAESLSLRDELAIARGRLSGSTCDSVRAYATTASVVLDQCIGAYQELAGKADSHAAGVELVMSAWPR